MFLTIIKKEILEGFLSLRVAIATLLCLVLIPIGMYVNLKSYEQRRSQYQQLEQLYQERSQGQVYTNFQAEGFRPPALLSIFAVGLEYYLPNKVMTAENGDFQISKEQGIDNPESFLLGRMDFLFSVGFVISLLGLIITFNCISGEKEDGSLRLALSNPVPRWLVILAKIVGNYIVLLVPFLVSLLIGLIILNMSSVALLSTSQVFNSFLLILAVTLLFILLICNLGVFISTLTHRSITSMVVALFIWTVFALAWPKICPTIAEIVQPVKSQQIHNFEKLLVRQNIEEELDRARRVLFDRTVITDFGLSLDKLRHESSERVTKAMATFDNARESLDKQYQERLVVQLKQMDEEYFNRRNAQSAMSRNLSRISPITCFMYLLAEISSTGTLELANFSENARQFQQHVKEQLYDKAIHRWYASTKTEGAWREDYSVPGFDPAKQEVPHLDYRPVTLSAAINAEWLDIVLLLIYNILFFAGSYVKFLKYDVR